MFDKSSLDPFLKAFVRAFHERDAAADQKDLERKNLEVLVSFFQAAGQGRFSEILHFFHENIVVRLHGPTFLPFLTLAEGPHQAASMVSANFKSLADQQVEVLSVMAQGDKIAFRSRNQGRVVSTRQEFWVEVGMFVEFQDSLLISVHQYVTDLREP